MDQQTDERTVREPVVLSVHTVPDDAPPERLDRYAAAEIPLFASRKGAYKAAKAGTLRVNGEPASPDMTIAPGMRLEVRAAGTPPPVYDLPLRVVLEDEDFAVIEKPPGIPVSGNYRHTVERALRGSLKASAALDALPWPRPVHRLDAPTGGLLLIAKTASAMVALSRQFQVRAVHKCYTAIVTGRLEGGGVVCTPIDGRQAETTYRTSGHTRSLHSEWLTTVEAEPMTGRTHQIRRHLAEIGHPIAGDSQYGVPGKTLMGKGLFLWATRLAFNHPKDGHEIVTTCPPPPKFSSYLRREERRYSRTTS